MHWTGDYCKEKNKMCLAIPGKVISRKGNVGVIDFGGITREAHLDLLEKVKIGDYVIVHAGYAIEKMSATDAKETLKYWKELERASF